MSRVSDRELSFDPGEIQRWADEATPWQAVAFMAACVERMLPNHGRFVRETGFGDVSAPREAVDTGWEWARSGRTACDLEGLKSRCERNAPDTTEHACPYTSAALDASVAAALLLESAETGRKELAVEVASLARDTVDLWVQEARDLDPEARDFEEAIRRDPLMQAELRAQRLDMDDLASGGGDRTALVLRVRRRAIEREGGSLGPV